MPNQTLSLTQQQRLQMVLAPQLRQSLEMLQVPILELRTMVQQELEQNPTLEEALGRETSIEAETPTDTANPEEHRPDEMDFDQEFEALAKLDEEWRDYFFQDLQSNPYTDDEARNRQFFLDSISRPESLQEHLRGQLTDLDPRKQEIAELLIGSISNDGYMTSTVEELAASASYDPREVEDVLALIQEDFHPTGVGARDLKECLLLQLARLGKSEGLAAELVRNHLDRLAAHKYQDIARALKVPVEDVQIEAKLVATLDPKPGRAFSEEVPAYVLPEVVVQKIDGQYVVLLNDDQLPHVKISRHYRDLLGDKGTATEVKSYIRERIRSGAFLIKSIHQRQRTIHRIAVEIVKAQSEFLDHGISHLKPLTMAEIASAVGVHETTVSRAVSGKYMQTPLGVFEMKYFFTPGIRTQNGTAVSNKTVKDMIAALVAGEDVAAPLSDQEIVERLDKENGVKIARRTIAKYRLLLKIPPSHMRKVY